LLAERQRLGGSVMHVGEAHVFEQGFGSRLDFPFLPAASPQTKRGLEKAVPGSAMGADHDVLEHRHSTEDASTLMNDGDAASGSPIRAQAIDTLSAQENAASVGSQVPGNHVEKRRLSSAVWTDDTSELALLDLEAYVLNGADTTESTGE
jgi:hypothetical protein